MNSNFVPEGAKQLLKKLSSQNVNKFMIEVSTFYRRCISYIELRENSFGEAEIFAWVVLHHVLEWNQIKQSPAAIKTIHDKNDR